MNKQFLSITLLTLAVVSQQSTNASAFIGTAGAISAGMLATVSGLGFGLKTIKDAHVAAPVAVAAQSTTLCGKIAAKFATAASTVATFAKDHQQGIITGAVGLATGYGAYKAYNYFTKSTDSKLIKAGKGLACFGTAAALTAATYLGYDKGVAFLTAAAVIAQPKLAAFGSKLVEFYNAHPRLVMGLGIGAGVVAAGLAGRAVYNRLAANPADAAVCPERAQYNALFAQWLDATHAKETALGKKNAAIVARNAAQDDATRTTQSKNIVDCEAAIQKHVAEIGRLTPLMQTANRLAEEAEQRAAAAAA